MSADLANVSLRYSSLRCTGFDGTEGTVPAFALGPADRMTLRVGPAAHPEGRRGDLRCTAPPRTTNGALTWRSGEVSGSAASNRHAMGQPLPNRSGISRIRTSFRSNTTATASSTAYGWSARQRFKPGVEGDEVAVGDDIGREEPMGVDAAELFQLDAAREPRPAGALG